jgi:hypothetical protein
MPMATNGSVRWAVKILNRGWSIRIMQNFGSSCQSRYAGAQMQHHLAFVYIHSIEVL